MKILYPIDNRVSLIRPNKNSKLSIKEIAEISVPAGLPFLIVEDHEVPLDDTWFEAWEVDFSNPDGIGKQKQGPNAI